MWGRDTSCWANLGVTRKQSAMKRLVSVGSLQTL